MRPAAWHANPSLQRVLRNFGLLLGGRAIGGVLALASTALSARVLGPAGFGVIALVHSYMLVIRGLLNIKPFEAIVRYGVPLLDDGDIDGLLRLLRVSLIFDLVTAVAGAIAATLIARLAAPLMGWSAETAIIAGWYSLVLLASGISTASGVLRIFDRFDAISSSLVLSNAWRLAGVVTVSFALEPSVAAIAAVWATSQVVQYLATLWFGWRVARRRLPQARWRGPLGWRRLAQDHADFWRFLNVVYWQSTLDLVPKSLGTLLAGTLLGTEGAAMFRIAREFSNVVAKPALLVRQAVYPDLARLQHRGDRAFGSVTVSIAAMMAIPAALLTVLSLWLGQPLLALIVGPQYVAAAGLLSWLIAAATLELAAAPLRPAGYALGVGGAILGVQVVASLMFMATFFAATAQFGLLGPGMATVTMSLVSLAGMALIVRRALVRVRRR